MLVLHQTGEPLLHNRIVDMVKYARDKGSWDVRFATNGILLNEHLSQGLIEAGLDTLLVSMDTSTAERYCPAKKERSSSQL